LYYNKSLLSMIFVLHFLCGLVRHANIAVATKTARMAATITSPNMSELELLTARAVELSSKVDFWNNAVLVVLLIIAVAGAAIFVAQRKAFLRAKDLSVVQDRIAVIKEDAAKTEQKRIGKELAESVAKAKEADARIAEAQQGSAAANKEAALARMETANTALRAGELEKDSATLRKQAEDEALDRQTAQAQSARDLEAERKKRAELAASLLPRNFFDQSGAMQKMSTFPRMSLVFEFISEREPRAFAEQIYAALNSLRWLGVRRRIQYEDAIRDGVKVSPGTNFPIPPNSVAFNDPIGGIQRARELGQRQVSTARDAATALVDILHSMRIEAELGNNGAELPPTTLLIEVGLKPNAALEQSIKELGLDTSATPISAPGIVNFRSSGNSASIPEEPGVPPKQ
jgi:hypothetical protein